METFHKLAGIQAESEQQEAPSQPVPQHPSIPDDGEEARRASRISLPLSRRASRKSLRSVRSLHDAQSRERVEGAHSARQEVDLEAGLGAPQRTSTASEGSDGTDSEEFAWGPNHPCFPHPNSHVAPNSKEAAATRVIRVSRKWIISGDLYPAYANLYPEIIDPLVTDSDFRYVVSGLNSLCKEAFDPFSGRAYLDSAVGMVTAWLWEDLGMTGAKKGERKIERFIDRWNAEKRQEKRDVRLVQLRETGFMSLDFIIPDPGIDSQDREDEQAVAGARA